MNDPIASGPPPARIDDLAERVGDLEVRDPYRWMERPSAELSGWVEAQGRYAEQWLAASSWRARLRARFAELLAVDEVGAPVPRGRRLYFRRRRAGAEHSSLCVREGRSGAERTVLDASALSTDGWISLGQVFPSADGTLAVCRLVERGTSRGALRVLDLTAGTWLEDRIPAAHYPLGQTRPGVNAALWTPDKRGFYYTRQPASAPADQPRYHQRVYFHRLGTDWRDDEPLFGHELAPGQSPYPRLSADGERLAVEVVNLAGKVPSSEVHVRDLSQRARGFVPAVSGVPAMFHAAWHRGRLYLKTNLDASRGRIVRWRGPGAALETVICEGEHVIGDWAFVGDYLFVAVVADARSRLLVHDLNGARVREIGLPEAGSIGVLEGEPEGSRLCFTFSSFLRPPAIYSVELDTLEAEPWIAPEPPFAAERFGFEQRWFESRDRTRVPMFVVAARRRPNDGVRPTVVHGYGGFNECKLPAYDPGIVPLLEAGGLYALANVRGGGEFGEDWHRAGMRANRQRGFDDFIAAGEALIAAGETTPARMGCYGWSNGGLLVNAVACRRPDLWRAVVAGAPVADLARFHLAGGRHWIADYGCPEDPEDLRFLLRLSPYHALPDSIPAPALLLIVPGDDDRVAPWHGYKMLARWQAASASGRVALLRTEPGAGHHGATQASRAVARLADAWTFLLSEFGLEASGGRRPAL